MLSLDIQGGLEWVIPSQLRAYALDVCWNQIQAEDMNTQYIGLGPVLIFRFIYLKALYDILSFRYQRL
jgi:hypothetical protein